MVNFVYNPGLVRRIKTTSILFQALPILNTLNISFFFLFPPNYKANIPKRIGIIVETSKGITYL